MAPRPGYELPLLLAAGFRSIVDDLHHALAARGHPGVRPVHGFALQAVGPNGATTSELGRRLGVTKQAAARTAVSLEELGYLTRVDDREDRRARRLRLTPRGEECLRLSAEELSRIRGRWAERLGAQRLGEIEDSLADLVVGSRLGDLPGWLR
jgi:DNA-binding MarR family transcriptional regulator